MENGGTVAWLCAGLRPVDSRGRLSPHLHFYICRQVASEGARATLVYNW